MGFIRNFEIWNNQRPRVCNFDVMDYVVEGVIGNSCTGDIRDIDDVPWENSISTARATGGAWLKAIHQAFLATHAFYRENELDEGMYGTPYIPSGTITRCISLEEEQRYIDLFFGPNAFMDKYKAWFLESMRWFNCLNDPAYKETGVISYVHNEFPLGYPIGAGNYTFTTDVTNYQTPTKEGYLSYREKLDAMLAALKIVMQKGMKHPMTHYDIVPLPCPDVPIGTQIWKRCNLNVTTYRNGYIIPQVTNPAAWSNLTTGAWCYYNNDPKTEAIFGKLYNWYAVNDPRGLAPVGYHIPTEAEWTILSSYLGGKDAAGSNMKFNGVTEGSGSPATTADKWFLWEYPSESDNIHGFSAVGVGKRDYSGDFMDTQTSAYWWTSTQLTNSNAWGTRVFNDIFGIDTDAVNKKNGYSIRVVKGETPIECPDVIIGTQTWTRCNLKTTTYRNGDIIPQVTNPAEWMDLTTGAWCYYNNDPSTEATYGKLYNWYALNDPRGIAPDGYHVPTDIEWNTLIDYLGGGVVAGGAMKKSGTTYWNSPNTDAVNSSGFTALPGGYRASSGSSNDIREFANFWSLSEIDIDHAFQYTLHYSVGSIVSQSLNKQGGLSVRLVKGEALPTSCPEITIGTQIWTGCNLNVSTYRNGDVIPQVTDPTEWANLTTGAWCYYDNDGPANNNTYGKLYNWYAVNDPRGLAPEGYHIPTDNEWTTLTDYLGGDPVAGGKLKEAGLEHWETPNEGATNESCFTGLPGGYRFTNGNYDDIGYFGYWWSSTENSASIAHSCYLDYSNGFVSRHIPNKENGFSVRVIKD